MQEWPRRSLTTRQYLETRENKVKHAGFDFRGKVLQRSLSALLYSEPKRAAILDSFEPILAFLIDSIKHVRKFRNYHIPKFYRDFN